MTHMATLWWSVIEIIGKRLKNAVKDRDLIGRYGGEVCSNLFCKGG